MQNLTFNLIDNPWIPCIEDSTGALIELSISEVLIQSHQLRALACESPLHDAAIMSLLLAVLHRVFGPSDESEWSVLYKRCRFPKDVIDAYLNRWHHRFDLFDAERPFYQIADTRVKHKSVIHLIHSMGNTGALFNHFDEAQGLVMSPAQAARALLAAQGFRTAGLSGLSEKFTDGTLSRGVLFFAESSPLFEMLMFNLVAYPESQYFESTRKDAPSWEQEDPHRERNAPYGYLDYLTWQSNNIMLIPEISGDQISIREMTVAPGLKLAEEVNSPHKLYQLRGKADKARWQRVDFSEDRALWRDYETLFAFDSDKSRPPVVLQWLHSLVANRYLPHEHAYHLRSIGLLADQAKPIFYRDLVMPIPDSFLSDAYYVRALEEARDKAELVERVLNEALSTFARYLLQRSGNKEPDKSDAKKLTDHWGVITNYWSRLETNYWTCVITLPTARQDALINWNESLKTLARHLLNETFRTCSAMQGSERAMVRATEDLNKGLKVLFEPKIKQQKG